MAEDDRKVVLKAELAAARERMATNLHALRRDFEFRGAIKRAFARQPIAWTAGASILGLVVARIVFRRNKVVVIGKGHERAVEKAEKAGLLLGILKIAFDLLKPTITKFATGFVADYARGRMGSARGPK